MRRTNRSLVYVAGYLLGAGLFLVAAPGLALRLLLSNGNYGDILPRLTGLLLLGLGILVVQIIRHRVSELYPTTLAVRAVFVVGFVALFAMSGDPLFVVLIVVVGIGMVATGWSLARDARHGDGDAVTTPSGHGRQDG